MEKEYKSYLNTKNTAFCCGCRSCEESCPKMCIEMKEKDGFIYPEIDKKKCIGCGICEKVCQYNQSEKLFNDIKKQRVFAGWNSNEEIVYHSTSGGIFTALSDYVLGKNGVVFGVAFDSQMEVKMQKAVSEEERNMFRGSKYVWSDTERTYLEAKKELEKGKIVLYSGVPCQISGLKAFLGKEYNNLICVDLVCHGLPSKILWNEYKKFLEKKYGSTIKKFKFRRRVSGMMKSVYYVKFANGVEITEELGKNRYSLTYNCLIAHMPSCYECIYTKKERVGDITIGDFWGIEDIDQESVNSNGTSVILVNSKRGNDVLQEISDRLVLKERTIEEAQRKNPALRESVKKRPWRENFFKSLSKHGFNRTFNIYVYVGNKVLIPYRIIRKIKEKVRG